MNAIKIENLWKQYQLGVIGHGTLTQDLQSWWAQVRGKDDPNSKLSVINKETESQVEGKSFWALRGVDLEVEAGSVLGIIGKNGAGKSTLLKVLSRVTAPTRGQIRIKGRVASLLEVGTGFHPELTGRENVFLNGAILGMSQNEIKRNLDAIVDFSGVEQHIDTPVKRYSSGMYVRLAFAVAAHLESELLIVDEVLAVGDFEFQQKCIGKMHDVSQRGRTVLFVSHNMAVLQKLCPNAILIDKGQVVKKGKSSDVVQHYLGTKTQQGGWRTWNWKDSEKSHIGAFIPLSLRILTENGEVSDRINSKQSFSIEIEYEVIDNVSNLKIGVTLSTGANERFCVAWDDEDVDRKPGRYVSRCEFPANLFSHGGFIVGIISVIPRVAATYRDFELLNLYFDDSATLSDLGRSILRPTLPWKTNKIQ